MTAPTIHMVPVPDYALPAVYEVLARLTSQQQTETTATERDEMSPSALVDEVVPEEDSVFVPGNGYWTDHEIEELAGMLKNDAGRAIIQAIALNSTMGDWTYYDELIEAGESVAGPDFGPDNVRAQLSWFAKYAKKIKGQNVWPMEVEDLGPEEPKGKRYRYLMPEPLAATWLANA